MAKKTHPTTPCKQLLFNKGRQKDLQLTTEQIKIELII